MLWVYLHRVFYIPAHVVAALWVAAGAHAALRAAERRGAGRRRVAVTALALAVLFAAWRGYDAARRSGGQVARNLALDLLDSAPPRAGFLPVGDDVLYPVLYARWVEGLRPDVHIVSRQYGWRGEPYSMLLSGDTLGAQMREDLPALRDYVAVPRGLVYALVPSSAQPAIDYASFVALPGPPRDRALDEAGEDLFVDAVRARYAAYHARLGARSLALGERAAGLAELDRAESLDPGDPHVELLLFRIYRDLGIRPQRRRALLESALANFDRTWDPHTGRYDPLRRSEIEAELATLPPRPARDAPPAGTPASGG